MQSESQKKLKELLKLEKSERTMSNYKDYTMETKALYEWKLPDGKYHREFGPAVEWEDGTLEWLQYDHLHREDGPAVIDKHGSEHWFRHGLLHREDGPAIIHIDGNVAYYFYNKVLIDQDHLDKCIKARDKALLTGKKKFKMNDISGNIIEIDLVNNNDGEDN